MKMNYFALPSIIALVFTLTACAAPEEKGHMEGEMKMDGKMEMGGHDEEITFGEVGKALGAKWAKTSDADKKKFA